MSKSLIEIDVIPPRNFSKGLPMKELRALFEPFLEAADLDGKFVLRCEAMQKGSAGKGNTIRFQWRPMAAAGSLEVIHINYQLSKPDTCMNAVLIPHDTNVKAKDVYDRLNSVHSAHCFVLSTYKADQSSTSPADGATKLWGTPELQAAALHKICDLAIADGEAFVTRGAIEGIMTEVFGDNVIWGPGGATGVLVDGGMVEDYDLAGETDRGESERRVFVTGAAFDHVDRTHPDDMKKADPEPGPELGPEPGPEKPKADLGGNLLTQLKNARKVIADHNEAKLELNEIDIRAEVLRKEVKVLEAEIQTMSNSLQSKRDKLVNLGSEAKRFQKALDNPDYIEAKELMEEIKALSLV